MSKCVITALATPFRGGKIDVNAYVKACVYQSENGADALLALGTTAEAQLLSRCERKLLLTLTKSCTTLTIIAGIEEPSTLQACRDAEQYAILGADAVMVAPPAFCKCTPQGYYKHVEAIKFACKLPVILYNIPSRAGYSLDVKTVKRLAEKGIAEYVKDGASTVDFAVKTAPFCKVLCGSDERLKQYMDVGACGVISVVSNVAPKLTKQAVNGDETAKKQFERLAYLAMREINPIAIKYLLYKAGMFENYDVRLPLSKASAKTRRAIDESYIPSSAE